MRRSTTRRTAFGAAAAAALATALISPTDAALASGPSVSIVVGGLAAPRGIAFDGQGSMYVAESGLAGSGPAGTNQTGKVSKYRWGQTTPQWSTTFSSLYASEDPSAPPDVLGPEGISALGNGCMNNSHGQREGCQIQMIMSESTLGVSAMTGGAINDPQAGHLYRLDGASGAVTDLADVGTQQYGWTAAHVDVFPSDFPDSNPYAVLVTRGARNGPARTFVADAGANTISEVMRDGTTRVVSYIPNETAPPFRDATPTCIAQGPDGYLYVGTLNLVANFVLGDGQSNVWRVDPNASYPTAPELWASGLTTVTACTFDRAGNFWAAEMFKSNPSGAPGDVVRIPLRNPGQQTSFGLGDLPLPGGIAQGPDGAMYVTIGSAAPGVSGAVARVSTS